MSDSNDIVLRIRGISGVIASAKAAVTAIIEKLRDAIEDDDLDAVSLAVDELEGSANSLANAIAAGSDIEGTEDALPEDGADADDYENPADNPNNNSNNPDSVEVEDQLTTPDEAAGEDESKD